MPAPVTSPEPAQAQAQSQTQVVPLQPLEYKSRSGLLDDACTADGRVKPEWEYVLGSLRDLGADVLQERKTEREEVAG